MRAALATGRHFRCSGASCCSATSCPDIRSSEVDNFFATAYWIAFGPHGPRALPPPGETRKVILYTLLGMVASGALFGLTRHFANKEAPRTMTKEWQEASEEYLK